MQTTDQSWAFRLCDEYGNLLESDMDLNPPRTAVEIATENPYGLTDIQNDALSRRIRDARMAGLREGQLIPIPSSRCTLRAESF